MRLEPVVWMKELSPVFWIIVWAFVAKMLEDFTSEIGVVVPLAKLGVIVAPNVPDLEPQLMMSFAPKVQDL